MQSEIKFRTADKKDIPKIWEILEDSIKKRKEEGSNQWQDGYPNLEVVRRDIERESGYIMTLNENPIGYIVVLINDEPAYSEIEGEWLSNGDFVLFHRVAISKEYWGKGLTSKMFEFVEDWAKNQNISSIKADTNFDNAPMLHLFEKFGYTYCGEVFFRGSPRKAFEKILE